METKKSPILVYREKSSETHTHGEFREAFEDSFAICFNVSSDARGGKVSLFTSVWEINPDALIAGVDLCVISKDSQALRDQFLIINKNGSKESANEIINLIEKSGIVKSAYCFYSEKKEGIKGGYHILFGNNKPSPLYKGNLIIDGNNLLLSVRHLNKSK